MICLWPRVQGCIASPSTHASGRCCLTSRCAGTRSTHCNTIGGKHNPTPAHQREGILEYTVTRRWGRGGGKKKAPLPWQGLTQMNYKRRGEVRGLGTGTTTSTQTIVASQPVYVTGATKSSPLAWVADAPIWPINFVELPVAQVVMLITGRAKTGAVVGVCGSCMQQGVKGSMGAARVRCQSALHRAPFPIPVHAQVSTSF